MATNIKIRFGNRLKGLRTAAGLSQEGLAFETGLSRKYISTVECGKINISLENIALLAKALKVTIPQLMPDR